jgi:alpha-amylase
MNAPDMVNTPAQAKVAISVPRFWLLRALVLVLSLWTFTTARGQAGFEDDRVMLQGFYWESYRHGHPEKYPSMGDMQWYDIVRQHSKEIRAGHFDLIWLPPPSYAGQYSAGYGPKQYFNLDNSYGTSQQHRAMLEALLKDGVEPVADLVLNHRDGDTGWTDFKNPDWGLWAICGNDEAFSNKDLPTFNAPKDQRGADEEPVEQYAPQRERGAAYAYGSFRDLDHTNKQVHHDIARYLLQLRSMGYRGWRYDMVHGYHARWVSYYNRISEPTFSVGEYDWGAHAEQRGWVWFTSRDTWDNRRRPARGGSRPPAASLTSPRTSCSRPTRAGTPPCGASA